MAFQSFVKSQFGGLGIQQILSSPPAVLLGVDAAGEAVLQTLRVRTVYDLALSTVFGNAARVVNEGRDLGSQYRRFGRAPASVIDKAELTARQVAALPLAELDDLSGIGPGNGPGIVAALALETIRDLALWPPYLAAKAIVVEAHGNGGAISSSDPEAPVELVPVSGEHGSERHLYSTVVMFPGTYSSSRPLEEFLFDVTETALTGFDRVRFGARLTFSQTWLPRHVAKGHLLHSLPLAPGESTSVAVIDWTNKSRAATEQQISESERLASTNDRTRTVSQVANSVASDFQAGGSVTTAQSGSASGGGIALLPFLPSIGTASASANESSSSTFTVSTGVRSVSTDLRQGIVDSTQQHSSSLRSQRAAVVSEVSQSDQRKFSTRSVTNYNHMHAMTVQYYEVVQVYETQVRIEDGERCIFIPMALFDFRDERNIFRYMSILKRAALDYRTRAALQDLEEHAIGHRLNWGHPRLPPSPLAAFFGTFRQQLLANLRGLDRRGFIRPGAGGLLGSETLVDFQVQLNNVHVVNSRPTSPRSLIRSIEIELEDGSTVSLDTPARASAGPADALHPALGGKPLSFGRIRAMRLVANNYVPANPPQAVVRLFLAVKLNGESRLLDASFVLTGNSATDANRTIFTVAARPEIEDLQQDLMDQQLYYSQQIWLRENPQVIVTQLAPLRMTIGGERINLVDYITPKPLTVAGNYIVYQFTYEKDADWQKWLKTHVDRSIVTADAVSIPTGGVFAEAVLGRFNSAEKLDLSRFANWSDSPPPNKPPEINAVKFVEPPPPTLPGQAQFDKPLVTIQAPISLGPATALTDSLAALVRGSAFPDVSGLAQSGAAGVKATEISSANSIAALKASGAAFTQILTSLTEVLKTAASKDATKTLSDVGALLNTKQATQSEPAPPAPGTTPEGDAESAPTPGPGAKLLEAATEGSLLASLASGAAPDTATDAATGLGAVGTPSDAVLLSSDLVTNPLFPDPLGFLLLLQVLEDAQLLDALETRFSNLDESVDVKAKYTELFDAFTAHSGQLVGADRILFGLRYLKTSILPEDATLDPSQVGGVKALALERVVDRAFAVAKLTFNSATAKEAIRQVCRAASRSAVHDINHVAYMFATAHHETRWGKFMTELSNGTSTATLFTKDAYFFDADPPKASYNGVNGNLLAGDQLAAAGVIAAAADVTTWNGTVYPHAQPAAVKIAARDCDFYRFIGRGLVQITGRANYQKFSNQAEVGNADFVANPQLVTEVELAARILVLGMTRGDFTTKKLTDFDGATFDGKNARKVVNNDVAANGQKIRDNAVKYKTALILNAKLDESTPYA